MKFTCYRCRKPIQVIRGVCNRFGKLILLDLDGSAHKHVFEGAPEA